MPTDAGSPRVDAGPTDTDAGPPVVVRDGGPDVPPPEDGGPAPMVGACVNPADDAIFDEADVDGAVGDCARDCFGAAMCVSDCVVESLGLSRPCAECFGGVSQCTVDNCAFQCIGGADSASCMSCRTEAGCTAAYATCSGRGT